MTEENKPAKKPWVVLRDVPADELEDKLIAYANDSYQAFRIDRVEHDFSDGGPASPFTRTVVTYDLIMFDPSQIAERQGRALAETMAKLAGLPAFGPGPAPSSG